MNRHIGNHAARSAHLSLSNGREPQCIDDTFVHGSLTGSGVDERLALDGRYRLLARVGEFLQDNLRCRYVHCDEWSTKLQALLRMNWLVLARSCIEPAIQNGH